MAFENDFNANPLDKENEIAFYKAIRNLPPNRKWKCTECNQENECSILAIYSHCAQCSTYHKMRAYWGGADFQDILLIALQWFQSAGVIVPQEMRSFIDDDWTDWDEYYADADE